jgi:hypothetical protein
MHITCTVFSEVVTRNSQNRTVFIIKSVLPLISLCRWQSPTLVWQHIAICVIRKWYTCLFIFSTVDWTHGFKLAKLWSH